METSDQKPAASGTGRRLGLKILGLFVLSAWMFGLGVWVGRGTAPLRFDIAKLETELAELKSRLLQEEQQHTAIAQEAASDWSNLDFYEALKKTGDDPLPNPEGPRDAGNAAAGRSETAKPKKSLKEATRAAEPPPTTVKARPPSAAAPPAKPPPGVPPPAAAGELTIQVASLRNPADAARLVQTLQAKGFAAYRVTGQIPATGTWYRVRVGAFKDRTSAQAVLERLKKEKFGGLVINH
ncbi:MAG: SPOR domain-containing protein [Desulfobacterales bacterium]